MTEIPQKDKEIIEQFAFSISEALQEALIESLSTVYKKGVLAERKTIIDRVLEIIDDCKFKYKEDEVNAWDGIQWHNRALEQAKHAVTEQCRK